MIPSIHPSNRHELVEYLGDQGGQLTLFCKVPSTQVLATVLDMLQALPSSVIEKPRKLSACTLSFSEPLR